MATTVEDLPRTTTDRMALGEDDGHQDVRREESRELAREEFFRTYDLMTGVRIAATLGGFFGMMVLLVLYKSRCRPRRAAIKEVRLAAAQAVVEEEDQQEAVAAAIYMQTVVTGRVPRRSLGALSAPVGPVGMGPLGPLGPSLAGGVGLGGSAADAAGLAAAGWGGAGGGLLPRAAFLGGDQGPGRPEDGVDPLQGPLPIRFSSLGGCSLLEAKVAISAVRRASMLPNPPTRNLQERLHLHQQHSQLRYLQHRRESRQLQLQRLEDALGTSVAPCASEYAAPTTAKAFSKARRHSHCPRASAAALAAGLGAAGAQKRHKPYALRSPLGVIDSSPEVASPAGSLGSEAGPAFASAFNQLGQAARPPRLGAQGRSQSLTPGLSPGPSLAHRGQPVQPRAGLSPVHSLGLGDAADVSTHSNSSACRALPYGAACESFELAEVAYGEACAPLARIATLETASLKDGEFADSGSDSVFGAKATQHGPAADTAADTGVDTGQDADTDQDADGQLSTDSAGSGSSTPHQAAGQRGQRGQRLYVLPVGVGVGGSAGPDMVTLHAAPTQGQAPAAKWDKPRLRPRLARTTKVAAASVDSAASDDCITTTPEQSQEDGEQGQQQDGRGEPDVGVLEPHQPHLHEQFHEQLNDHGDALERHRF